MSKNDTIQENFDKIGFMMKNRHRDIINELLTIKNDKEFLDEKTLTEYIKNVQQVVDDLEGIVYNINYNKMMIQFNKRFDEFKSKYNTDKHKPVFDLICDQIIKTITFEWSEGCESDPEPGYMHEFHYKYTLFNNYLIKYDSTRIHYDSCADSFDESEIIFDDKGLNVYMDNNKLYNCEMFNTKPINYKPDDYYYKKYLGTKQEILYDISDKLDNHFKDHKNKNKNKQKNHDNSDEFIFNLINKIHILITKLYDNGFFDSKHEPDNTHTNSDSYDTHTNNDPDDTHIESTIIVVKQPVKKAILKKDVNIFE